MSYFLKNYEELTLFVDNRELPVDNNSQERLLRSPVIGPQDLVWDSFSEGI